MGNSDLFLNFAFVIPHYFAQSSLQLTAHKRIPRVKYWGPWGLLDQLNFNQLAQVLYYLTNSIVLLEGPRARAGPVHKGKAPFAQVPLDGL